MPTTEEELRNLCAGSASLVRDAAGIPNAALMLDGCHIRIPFDDRKVGHMDWKSRKGFYAMVLQAACDFRSQFRSVQVGWCGSVHDARVFRSSTVGQSILAGTVFGGLTCSLPNGTTLPLGVLTDAAYPKAECVIKPEVDGGNLTDPQLWTEYCQSVQRQPIERGFGRMKGRWRVLLLRAYHKLTLVPVVIIACCVLHNICEQHAEGSASACLDERPRRRLPAPVLAPAPGTVQRGCLRPAPSWRARTEAATARRKTWPGEAARYGGAPPP